MLLPSITLALSFFLPQVPDATIPADAHAKYTVAGHGVQVYKCTAQTQTTPATFKWGKRSVSSRAVANPTIPPPTTAMS